MPRLPASNPVDLRREALKMAVESVKPMITPGSDEIILRRAEAFHEWLRGGGLDRLEGQMVRVHESKP